MNRCFYAWALSFSLLACHSAAKPHTPPVPVPTPPSAPRVLTHHNDNQRTAANLLETSLSPRNVRPESFGRLYERRVIGNTFAQPLYLPGVEVRGHGRKNLVFVATMANRLYALDADEASPDPEAGQIWAIGPEVLGEPVQHSDTSAVDETLRPDPQTLGIMSTPAIDADAGMLYVVSTHEAPDGAWAFTLNAVDVTTGTVAKRVGISGAVSGPAGGQLVTHRFAPGPDVNLLNRPALLLAGRVVYVSFGSFGDSGNYRGWIMAYDVDADWSARPAPLAVFSPASNDAHGAAIWQSGAGPATDETASRIYVMSGNGPPVAAARPRAFEDSFISLRARTLDDPLGWAPPDFERLEAADTDLGAGGPLLVPGSDMLLGGGKNGVIYVLPRSLSGAVQATQATSMNPKYALSQDAPITTDPETGFPTTYDALVEGNTPNIHGGMAFWRADSGARVYVWGEKDRLKAFTWRGDRLQPNPVTGLHVSSRGMPGGALSLSADGATGSSGVLWATIPETNGPPAWRPDLATDDGRHRCGQNPRCDANYYAVPGRLLAFSAETLELLYDAYIPVYAKYVPPTVVAGKAFVATFADRLLVFGLRSSAQEPAAEIAFPADTAPASVGAPSAVLEGDVVHAFVTADQKLFEARFGLRTPAAPAAWSPLDEGVVSPPVAVRVGGTTHVLARAAGGGLRHLVDGESQPRAVAVDAAGAPAVAVLGVVVHVVTRASDGTLLHVVLDGDAPTVTPVPTATFRIGAGAEPVLAATDATLHLLFRDERRALVHCSWVGAWRDCALASPACVEGGATCARAWLADPAVVAGADGRLEAFGPVEHPLADPALDQAVYSAERPEWLAALAFDGASWARPEIDPFVGVRLDAVRASASDTAGGVQIVAVGIDGVLQTIARAQGVWGAWEPLRGAAPLAAPVLVAGDPLLVIARSGESATVVALRAQRAAAP